MTKIHEDNQTEEDADDDDDEEEEPGDEGANKEEKKEASSKKIVRLQTKRSLKRKNTQSFSMNSIDVSKVNSEDLLTLVKMRRLKNLFNVCRANSQRIARSSKKWSTTS